MNSYNSFHILAVCTGNVCRSPLAEVLLDQALKRIVPGAFSINSAGTGALVGHTMTPQIQGYAHLFGADTDTFVSRQLTTDILTGQDLVLALTRDHRSKVVEYAPALVRKTFTLREFARILPLVEGDPNALPAERWTAAVKAAARKRTTVPGDPADDDVVDPYRRSDEVHQQMLAELAPAVKAIAAWEAEFHTARTQ